MKIVIENCAIELVVGDITDQGVDAIANAANSRLAGGGGVDGAIHRRGGPTIMHETNSKYPQGCPSGSAVISAAGELPAKHVIHAVGPVWRGGQHEEASQLADAYRASLQLAVDHNCQSVAFPALSCGAYCFPLELASQIALATTVDFLRGHQRPQLVRFVLFDRGTYDVFSDSAGQLTDVSFE